MINFKKYRDIVLPKSEMLDSSYAIWFSVVWLMLLLAILKLLYIFYVTRRGAGLGWPFNSYLFDPFHRFTDWLITYRWAEEANPWKANHPLLASLPPVPYGPVTFLYLKAGHSIGAIGSFFLALLAYLGLSFGTVCLSLEPENKNRAFIAVFIFTALILIFYPIHFLVDRGNVEVIPATFIAAIFLILIYSSNIRNTFSSTRLNALVDTLIILAASCKPTWLPLIAFTITSGSFKRVSFVIASVIAVYAFPLVFQGVALTDYGASIRNALNIFTTVSAFSHNLTNGVRPFIESPQLAVAVINKYVLFLGAFYSLAMLIFCFWLRFKTVGVYNRANLDILILSHVLICILLFNHPSPDYRLVVLLPALAAILAVWDNIKEFLGGEHSVSRKYVLLIAFGVAVVSSWTGFYSRSGFSLFTPIRAWLLVVVDVAILMLCYRARGFLSTSGASCPNT